MAATADGRSIEKRLFGFSVRRWFRQQRRVQRKRASRLGLLALHAFPVLYCTGRVVADETTMASLLAIYRGHLRRKLAKKNFFLRTVIIIGWLPASMAVAVGLTARNGRFVAHRHGRGIVRQLRDQVALAFGQGVFPSFYYSYGLYDSARRAQCQEYLHRYLLKDNALYELLYRDRPDARDRAKLLNDKTAFLAFCDENSLPTARIYAIVSGSDIRWHDAGRTRLPQVDLFVKPQRGKGGRGVERWAWRNGRFQATDGRSLDAAALLDHLRELAAIKPLLVQECLVNHPGLERRGAGALNTLRTYTVTDEDGRAEHIFSMFRMSRDPGKAVDNIHAGGLAAGVDSRTGTLGPATNFTVLARDGWHERHPTTGARIAGYQLPFWPEVLDLALAAHRQLGGAFVVGWDIAITPDGPLLVEGNKSPDIEIEQKLAGPWGNARFGQLLLHHLTTQQGGAET